MKIIGGEFRGKLIPFSNKKFDNADITPQKIKGALFSMLGEDLSGKSFLDLFAGSGQMGIEALSRGAEPVIFNELDKKRYLFIKSFVEDLGAAVKTLLLNAKALKSIQFLGEKSSPVDYIFLDPPYVKEKSEVNIYGSLLNSIEQYSILKEDGVIIIQHFKENSLADSYGNLMCVKSKVYGSSAVSLFKYQG
ncbi:MAG: 16S rRNA (guanine(966)-N(2))-methyltransferase RsmD [bacterium]|nr:16S rRNA (guanine(966)-N(2))-methyltransferase RsmD [bacterium]